MSGGWVGSTRKETLPPDWDERVRKVHARSGGRCEWPVKLGPNEFRRCPNRADGGVDHWKDRLYHELDGLRDSCHRHHAKKSSHEGHEGKKKIKERAKRPAEPHPNELLRRRT